MNQRKRFVLLVILLLLSVTLLVVLREQAGPQFIRQFR